MFPDFSALARTGDQLGEKFDRLVALLEKISDDTAAIRAHLEADDDGK